jgi:putative transposase
MGVARRTAIHPGQVLGYEDVPPPPPPDHIRSDNGAEFTALAVRDWLGRIGVKTLFITPGSPWENEYVLAEPSFAWTRAFMASSEISCLTVRSSPHYAKLRFSLSAGETITMPSGRTRLSAIAHRLQKRSCRLRLSWLKRSVS